MNRLKEVRENWGDQGRGCYLVLGRGEMAHFRMCVGSSIHRVDGGGRGTDGRMLWVSAWSPLRGERRWRLRLDGPISQGPGTRTA